jgi:predicted membrane-bound mannosyltransferase
VALAVFVAVSVLFYSSFFTNYPKGVLDSLKTFMVWTKTGQQAHVHPGWKYLEWLLLQESPVLILGIVGAVIAVWQGKNAIAIFSALWAFGILAAYSLIPYKTPWLTLNFIVPLAIISGFAFQAIYEYAGGQLGFVVAVLLVAASVSIYQAIDLNFFNYDNDKKTIDVRIGDEPRSFQYYTYVYAHTRRDILALVDEINRLARVSGEGQKMGITIVSSEYWPLPWYFRDYTRVGYFGRITTSTETVIIASENQRPEVLTTFADRYELVDSRLNPAGSYPLRPGVELLLLVRRGLPR